MAPPSPPPKPEGLKALSVVSEEHSVASSDAGANPPITNGVAHMVEEPPAVSDPEEDLVAVHRLGTDRNGRLSDPFLNGSAPNDVDTPKTKNEKSASESFLNSNQPHKSSTGSVDRQFEFPRRSLTASSIAAPHHRRADSATLTPRLSRRQTSRLILKNDSGPKDDAALEAEEEQFGIYAQRLINFLPKPKKRPDGKFTFKDAINYFITTNRIRKAVGDILDASLCPTCRLLDLKPEKFLVHDRERSLKDSRLGRSATNVRKKVGRFEVGSGSPSCRLGNLKSIMRKSVVCPFCRLIVHSLKEQENTEWMSMEAITQRETTNERARELEAVCFASWRIDGREVAKPSDNHYSSSRSRTRRICLHWQPPIFRESFLVLVGTPTLPPSFLGRRVESGRCNPKLMKSWINTCCSQHGPRCETPRDPRFKLMINQAFFGVLDVHEMRLTRLPADARYIALSYTWGGVQQFCSTLSNMRSLQAPRGVEKIIGSLPRTLRDAIALVRDLGERYLWVDSMCIVQDSTKSWELNASVMDLVYGNAHVTICAADGDKPDTGLHGMNSRQRHFSQHMEDYAPGLRLMVSFLAESYIKSTHWAHRGWTFQERLLSKRCLLFTDSRVFFQCRSATMREDITEEEHTGWSIEHAHAPWQILDDLDGRGILSYMNSVKRYTSRELSRPENILSAFQGIGNMIGKSLSPTPSHSLFGLPRSHFDFALLWEPQHAAHERLIEEKDPTDPNKTIKKRVFPSWSWCGWSDTVMEYKPDTLDGTTTNLHEWLMEHTWISWYFRDGHGSLKLVWDYRGAVSHSDRPNDSWTGYAQNAMSPPDEPLDAYGRKLSQKWPDRPRAPFQKTIPEYPFGVLVSQERHEPDIQFPDQRFLQFWTWSAFLRVTEQPPADANSPLITTNGDLAVAATPAAIVSPMSSSRQWYGISDYKGDWCGTIVLDQGQSKRFDAGAEHEFIAISEAKGFSKEEYDSWEYYIPKEKEQSEWDLFYVLLIEVQEEIAYRVGLGKVFKEAFENSCREEKEWKEIILG